MAAISKNQVANVIFQIIGPRGITTPNLVLVSTCERFSPLVCPTIILRDRNIIRILRRSQDCFYVTPQGEAWIQSAVSCSVTFVLSCHGASICDPTRGSMLKSAVYSVLFCHVAWLLTVTRQGERVLQSAAGSVLCFMFYI